MRHPNKLVFAIVAAGGLVAADVGSLRDVRVGPDAVANVSNISFHGTISGAVFRGDGSQLTGISAGSAGSTQIVELLGIRSGAVTSLWWQTGDTLNLTAPGFGYMMSIDAGISNIEVNSTLPANQTDYSILSRQAGDERWLQHSATNGFARTNEVSGSSSAWPTGTVTWVSVGGDDLTGAVNDESKPFATLAAARLAVSNILSSAPTQGWTIAARGMRFTNEVNILLPGHVNWDFSGCDFVTEGAGALFLMGTDNGYTGPTDWSGWIKIGSYVNTTATWPCGLWISVSGSAAVTIDIERDVLVSGDSQNAITTFDSGVGMSISAKTINGTVYATGPCKIIGANLLQGVTSGPGNTGVELFNCVVRRTSSGNGQAVIGNYGGSVRVYNSVLVGDGCPVGMAKYSSSTFVFLNCAMKVLNGFGYDNEENENDGIICADESGTPLAWFLGGCVSAQNVGTECTVSGGSLSVVADIPIE